MTVVVTLQVNDELGFSEKEVKSEIETKLSHCYIIPDVVDIKIKDDVADYETKK